MCFYIVSFLKKFSVGKFDNRCRLQCGPPHLDRPIVDRFDMLKMMGRMIESVRNGSKG